MRWPWVSRAAYDLARATVAAMTEDRAWLRAQLETALDHNRRLERVAAKVHEVPVTPKPAREPMPKDIRETFVDCWTGSEATRANQEAGIYALRAKLGSWDEVREELAKIGPDAD